jgi:hypothetical protein
MDFDPRDSDTRDQTRDTAPQNFEYDDDLTPSADRDRDNDAREPGRGPGDSRQSDQDGDDGRGDARWPERERSHDPRDVFSRDLYLPRGPEREMVHDRDREYTLRGSETRTLATVGAFRVVSSRDLRDQHDRPLDPRSSDLRHLREQRLVETVHAAGCGRAYPQSQTRQGRP